MPGWIRLQTPVGPVNAWHAEAKAPVRGGVVVVQEVFGANTHIREVAMRLAEAGYETLAPSLFDPVAASGTDSPRNSPSDTAIGVALDYDEAGMARGRELAGKLGFTAAVGIVQAAAMYLQRNGTRQQRPACAVIGFCWGGSVTLLANTRFGLPAVAFYGARSLPFLDEPLRAPMQFHFGAEDALIPLGDIARHRQAWPQADIHVYADAGHAFARDVDPAHHRPAAAALAWRRTHDFLAEVLA